MKRQIVYLAIASIVFSMSFPACSKGKDTESKKGKIDAMTDRAAESATKKIKTPIDKARTLQEKENERVKAMEEDLKKQ